MKQRLNERVEIVDDRQQFMESKRQKGAEGLIPQPYSTLETLRIGIMLAALLLSWLPLPLSSGAA